MTDKKLTDEEVVKALECCKDCCCKQCDEELNFQEAIDLINRQKEDIEALYRINAESEKEIYEIRKELLGKENLEESFKRSVRDFDKRLEKTVKLERVYAYKEFAERLNEKAQIADCFDSYNMVVGTHFIDNLLKEMVGEEE